MVSKLLSGQQLLALPAFSSPHFPSVFTEVSIPGQGRGWGSLRCWWMDGGPYLGPQLVLERNRKNNATLVYLFFFSSLFNNPVFLFGAVSENEGIDKPCFPDLPRRSQNHRIIKVGKVLCSHLVHLFTCHQNCPLNLSATSTQFLNISRDSVSTNIVVGQSVHVPNHTF